MTAALYEVGISWTRSTALQSVGIEAGQTIAGGDVQGLCFCPKGGKIFIIPLILTWLHHFNNLGGGEMPSLTHVCIFADHKWIKITPPEAAAIFPETVSAQSGIFMCALCHQYVYFSGPGAQVRHFGHTPEVDKTCPERTQGASVYIDSNSGKHDLPIRLKLLPLEFPTDFELEIGLLGVPDAYLGELQGATIQIIPEKGTEQRFKYDLQEHVAADRITYVSIGGWPSPEYQIKLNCGKRSVLSFWPERIRGIDPNGTLFDGKTRKKLPYDADVQVGASYYLLQANGMPVACGSIFLEHIFTKSTSERYWRLYRISAKTFDEDSARFFLEFHCRLTDQPISIQPIWPVYRKGPYAIHHNSEEVVFHVQGDVTAKSYPRALQQHYSVEGGGAVEYISCRDRQQLISAGRAYQLSTGDFWRRLKYTYLWQEPLCYTEILPNVVVTDITGRAVLPGPTNALPPKEILCVRTEYDGLAILKRNGQIVEKRRLRADETSKFSTLQFGCELSVLQGLDRIWSIQYQRRVLRIEQGEEQLLRRLRSAGGPPIPVPHTWGAAAAQLKDYPQVRLWLYQKIRDGSAPERACRELLCFLAHRATR